MSGVLAELCRLVGIADAYDDAARGDVVHIAHETRMQLLAALGFDATSEKAARVSLAALRDAAATSICEPVRVATVDGAGTVPVNLSVSGGKIEFHAEVRTENGDFVRASGSARGGSESDTGRSTRIETGLTLPFGYHDMRLAVKDAGGERQVEQRIIVTPWRCTDFEKVLGGRRALGYAANLYSVRGSNDWGMGNLGTLQELLTLVAGRRDCASGDGRERSAAFLGVNPLHALRNRAGDVSPYAPSSRLFRNILYIDFTAVPELERCDEAKRYLATNRVQAALQQFRSSSEVRHEELLEMALPLLHALHRTFRSGSPSVDAARSEAYRTYRERQGTALHGFGTFEAIASRLHNRGDPGASDWRTWTPSLRECGSEAVRTFALEHEEEVDFHMYLQFELDRQLSLVQEEALRGGMSIGLYGDLALCSAATGFDAWAHRRLFVDAVTVGAPPDAFAPEGQTWGCPPISPLALRASSYAYWSHLLRAGFKHCGMLRMDHVMGLWRQFWVPDGETPRGGAYVAYPCDDLLGILALESVRAGAIVVGEDLGTVAPMVRPAMRERSMLSCKVLYFERAGEGPFGAPGDYDHGSLASANTHDLPPLAGWWLGGDIAGRFGESADRERLTEEVAWRRTARERLLDLLTSARLITADAADRLLALDCGTGAPLRKPDRENMLALVRAIHEILCGGNSMLVAIALDDLALETEAVNRPGSPTRGFRSWSRRMAVRAVETMTP